jgi:hypothetical protein
MSPLVHSGDERRGPRDSLLGRERPTANIAVNISFVAILTPLVIEPYWRPSSTTVGNWTAANAGIDLVGRYRGRTTPFASCKWRN